MNRTGRWCVSLIVLVLLSHIVHAQCEGPEYEGFDFWLGEWTIEQQFLDPAEESWIELPARTTVSKVLEGCALLEHWSGEVVYPWTGMNEARSLEGVSIRYWMRDEKQWKIHWMDSMRPYLGNGSVGTIEDGVGEFHPETLPDTGRWSKIVFERQDENHVYWHLDHTRDSGETWITIWKMHMSRE